ncbi:hypothetical protein B0H11DRAFT_282987 [Mycena galericulata]|nr:hypothetical protein B0H11DRAFT_282987 [Mycena galericulata]
MLLPFSRIGAIARFSDFRPGQRKIFKHIFISVFVATVLIGISVGLAKALLLSNVKDQIPLSGSAGPQIGLIADFLKIDNSDNTVTVDWYTSADQCSSPGMVVNIFFDPNLLSNGGGSEPPSTYSPSEPTFRLNTTQGCNYGGPPDSFAIFRTVSKLTGRSTGGSSQSSPLRAYPFDKYFLQISTFATLESSNTSVAIAIERSFGVPINFDVKLDPTQSQNTEQGVLLTFNVNRSSSVKALVVIVMVANWLTTFSFLCVTIAAISLDVEIVKEMFVLPIGALFAFTSVRANLPGAPPGFGDSVDYYGILPNLALITLFSAIMLLTVLFRRALKSEETKNKAQAPTLSSSDETKNNSTPVELELEGLRLGSGDRAACTWLATTATSKRISKAGGGGQAPTPSSSVVDGREEAKNNSVAPPRSGSLSPVHAQHAEHVFLHSNTSPY